MDDSQLLEIKGMIEIRHIGVMPLCGLDPDATATEVHTTDRTDLSYAQYMSYQRSPFVGEKFRYCKRCLASIRSKEKRFW